MKTSNEKQENSSCSLPLFSSTDNDDHCLAAEKATASDLLAEQAALEQQNRVLQQNLAQLKCQVEEAQQNILQQEDKNRAAQLENQRLLKQIS